MTHTIPEIIGALTSGTHMSEAMRDQVVEIVRRSAVETVACKYGDPYCPCQDGDACHYEPSQGTPGVACVPTEYVRRALAQQHDALVLAEKRLSSIMNFDGQDRAATDEDVREIRVALGQKPLDPAADQRT